MSNQQNALRLALEALTFDGFMPEDTTHQIIHTKAIKALEEALKQEQGETEYKCTESDAWNCKYCKKMETCKAIDYSQNFGKPKQEQGEVEHEQK